MNGDIPKLRALSSKLEVSGPMVGRMPCGGKEYANHHIAGMIPLDFGMYRTRLARIQSLSPSFDAQACVK